MRGHVIIIHVKEADMTFGEKLKKLRIEKGLTQEQLAEKIYVTRTAVSKWETDRGYPSVDSLKLLSDIFGVSVDSLISRDDIKNKQSLEKKRKRVFYIISAGFLAAAVLFVLLAHFLETPILNAVSVGATLFYVIFAMLSSPPADRAKDRKTLIYYVLSRIIIAAVMGAAVVSAIIRLYA